MRPHRIASSSSISSAARHAGRLAEILGTDGLESDVLYRTLGLGHIADKEWTTLPDAIQNLLASYTAGINCACRGRRLTMAD